MCENPISESHDPLSLHVTPNNQQGTQAKWYAGRATAEKKERDFLRICRYILCGTNVSSFSDH